MCSALNRLTGGGKERRAVWLAKTTPAALRARFIIYIRLASKQFTYSKRPWPKTRRIIIAVFVIIIIRTRFKIMTSRDRMSGVRIPISQGAAVRAHLFSLTKQDIILIYDYRNSLSHSCLLFLSVQSLRAFRLAVSKEKQKKEEGN